MKKFWMLTTVASLLLATLWFSDSEKEVEPVQSEGRAPASAAQNISKIQLPPAEQMKVSQPEKKKAIAQEMQLALNEQFAKYEKQIKNPTYFKKVIEGIYESQDSSPLVQGKSVEFVGMQNSILFDHQLGPRHQAKPEYMKLIKKTLSAKDALAKRYLAREITQLEYREALAQIINRFRDENAKVFSPQDFEKLFRATPTDDFARLAGI